MEGHNRSDVLNYSVAAALHGTGHCSTLVKRQKGCCCYDKWLEIPASSGIQSQQCDLSPSAGLQTLFQRDSVARCRLSAQPSCRISTQTTRDTGNRTRFSFMAAVYNPSLTLCKSEKLDKSFCFVFVLLNGGHVESPSTSSKN